MTSLADKIMFTTLSPFNLITQINMDSINANPNKGFVTNCAQNLTPDSNGMVDLSPFKIVSLQDLLHSYYYQDIIII